MSELISEFLVDRISSGDFPSAVYWVADRGDIVFGDSIGNAVVDPEIIAATESTIYDVASLTKVLSTGLLAAMAIESGEIDPNAPIATYLNELYATPNSEITVNHLAMHRSGLPAWLPFYLIAEDRYSVTSAIANVLPSGGEPDVIYSDLNFILLADILETVHNDDLANIFAEKIAEPLGLANTFFSPPNDQKNRIAASEFGNRYERQMCEEKFPDLEIRSEMFRDNLIWGEVHDGNAHFLGGAAGHAGLFSTAKDVFAIAKQYLGSSSTLLKPETCELFRTNFTSGMSEDRSFAFQLASTKDSTAGTELPHESFGHNGFTGTSLWIDPVNDRIFVLLTNRTHNRDLPFANINRVRREFHDLSVTELERIR